METVKSFFSATPHTKDATLSNSQQNGLGFFAGQRSMPAENAYTNGGGANNGAKMNNNLDAKRKDNDNYFYIMWRS